MSIRPNGSLSVGGVGRSQLSHAWPPVEFSLMCLTPAGSRRVVLFRLSVVASLEHSACSIQRLHMGLEHPEGANSDRLTSTGAVRVSFQLREACEAGEDNMGREAYLRRLPLIESGRHSGPTYPHR